MSEKTPEKEKYLYEPIRKALERIFSCLGECHLEITTKGFSNQLKRVFDDVALYMIRVESFYPDISGYVRGKNSTDIIIVEVKPNEPMIKDMFQAKDYAEIFNAKYAILASPQSISEEKRRLILKRREIISRYPKDPVIIARFRKPNENFEIDKELYLNSLPEPFKTNFTLVEAEKLEFGPVIFKEDGVYVTVSNLGTSPVEIVETRIYGTAYYKQSILMPEKAQKVQLAERWSPGWTFAADLITRNGNKYHLEAQAPGMEF